MGVGDSRTPIRCRVTRPVPFVAFRFAQFVVCVVGGILGGCQTRAPNAFVGDWGKGPSSLVVRANGLAEGQLFAATAPQAFTWRVDGPTIRLNCGRIASDAVEYRGALDAEGRLVIESDTEQCVLVRSKALAGR